MMKTARRWRPVSAAGVALLFLAAFFFGGLWVGELGIEYRLFGLVDGLAALLILYVLLNSGALSWPLGGWGAVVLIYAGLATAQLVGLLLPPPGLLEWLAVGILLYMAFSASYAAHRTRVVLTLGLIALALALLKYSALPFVWGRARLPSTPLIDLQPIGEGLKRTVVEYTPGEPITQLWALLAIVAWVFGLWWQWPPEAEDDWLRRLSRADRDRLLIWLLRQRDESGRALSGEEVRGYLDRGEVDR